jgi:hypothetical protein
VPTWRAEEERKEQEKEEARQARMDRLYEQNIMSQIATREPEEETPSLPKFSFETPEGVSISGEANEEMQKALEQYGVKPPKPEKEEKPAYGKDQAWDDAIGLWQKRRKTTLSQAEEDANKVAAELGGELPHKIDPMPSMEEIQATADSLFKKQNLGVYDDQPESDEQNIIKQITANPELLQTTDWNKVKKDNPNLDWDAIFNALENI